MLNLNDYYDIDPSYEITPLSIHSVNELYLVNSKGKKYILKSYLPQYTNTITNAISAQNIVNKETRMSPQVYSNRNGQFVTKVETEFFTLQEFVKGEPYYITAHTLEYFVQSLFNLHKCLDKHFINILVKDESPMNYNDIKRSINEAKNSYARFGIKNDAFEQLLEKRHHMLITKKLEYSPCIFTIIHADLRPANIIMSDNNIKYIDFDYLKYGDLFFELGSAISLLSNFNQRICEDFVKSYSEIVEFKITVSSLFEQLLSYYVKSNFPLSLLTNEPEVIISKISLERIQLINFCNTILIG